MPTPMVMPKDLRPEQLRALAYAKKRGTLAPVDEIRQRVRSTYTQLDGLLASIGPETARQHKAASGWSIQEVVDHLLESDRRAAEQLAALLRGEEVDEAIPASLQSADPMSHEWSGLRQQLQTVHETVLELLEDAPDDVPLATEAPVTMVVKCAEPDGSVTPVTWVARFDWKAFAILLHAHNLEHVAQIQRSL